MVLSFIPVVFSPHLPVTAAGGLPSSNVIGYYTAAVTACYYAGRVTEYMVSYLLTVVYKYLFEDQHV